MCRPCYYAAYRRANAGAIREGNAVYRRANAGAIKESKAAYAKANPEAWVEYVNRRRARKAGVESTLTPAQERALFERTGHRCTYCDEPATTLDHIVPISRGGAHALSNVTPACRSCNSSKWATPVEEWYPRRIAVLVGAGLLV